ncbi:unnamed protein product, partial [Ectocarpus sp. 12 AP-2014]
SGGVAFGGQVLRGGAYVRAAAPLLPEGDRTIVPRGRQRGRPPGSRGAEKPRFPTSTKLDEARRGQRSGRGCQGREGERRLGPSRRATGDTARAPLRQLRAGTGWISGGCRRQQPLSKQAWPSAFNSTDFGAAGAASSAQRSSPAAAGTAEPWPS